MNEKHDNFNIYCSLHGNQSGVYVVFARRCFVQWGRLLPSQKHVALTLDIINFSICVSSFSDLETYNYASETITPEPNTCISQKALIIMAS